MKTWIKQTLATVTALGVGAMMFGAVARADDAPIATYGFDIVTDYVFRGVDQYVTAFDKEQNEHTALNMAPSFQPTLTLFGPNGVSLNIWGAFAISDRADDTKKGFTGLGKLDEIDYTLAYDWSNKMGGFTAAIIQYTYLYATAGATVTPDFMIKWAMPVAKSANPYLAYYANSIPGAEYAVLGVSGGESLVWAASFGEKASGPSDITFKIGYVLGDITISFNGAYRPTPLQLGPYDKDGHYFVKGEQKTYPSTIAWLDLGWGGSVAAK